MVAPSFEMEGRMAAGLGCTTTGAALRELSGIRLLLYKLSMRTSFTITTVPRGFHARAFHLRICHATEVPLDETGVEFDEDRID